MKIKYIKGLIALLLILMINTVNSLSQEFKSELLFETKNSMMQKSEFAKKYSANSKFVKSFREIGFNSKILSKNTDHISFKIENKLINVKKDKFIEKGLNTYSFVGSTEGNPFRNVVITYRNDYVYGVVYTDSVKYNIVTFKNGDKYLMEIDKNQSGCVTQNHHQNDPSNVKKLQANNLASNNQGSNTEEVLTNSSQTNLPYS